MNLSALNPVVHDCAIYERINRTEPCVCYSGKILYLISGEVSYTFYDTKTPKKARLSPGNLLYIPAGKKYSLRSKYMKLAVITLSLYPVDGGKSLVVPHDAFDESVPIANDIPPFDSPLFNEDFESDRDEIIKMTYLFTSGEGLYLDELSAKVKLLMLKIANLSDEDSLPASMVENLDNYIRENIHDEISNTELGAIFGYHPFYISRMLKSKKGITLHQYVMNFRMKSALKLLECSDMSIQDIADSTGFTDASYFTKTFKAQMGMTPKEYRNKFKEDFI